MMDDRLDCCLKKYSGKLRSKSSLLKCCDELLVESGSEESKFSCKEDSVEEICGRHVKHTNSMLCCESVESLCKFSKRCNVGDDLEGKGLNLLCKKHKQTKEPIEKICGGKKHQSCSRRRQVSRRKAPSRREAEKCQLKEFEMVVCSLFIYLWRIILLFVTSIIECFQDKSGWAVLLCSSNMFILFKN